ncbi:MAG: hypothetical protein JNJ88_16445 [Planctomycetes bacterium]|nr:hypothetical protein [Planctomycetota bacterium]
MSRFACSSPPAALLALLLSGAAMAPAVRAFAHEDKRLGFKIDAPSGWNELPLAPDEKWIVGRFKCSKLDIYVDREWGGEHYAEMTIIAFPAEETSRKGPKVTKDGDSIKIDLSSPYKNYKEYFNKTYTGGGHFVDAEKEAKVGPVAATQLSIKVEKLTSNGPRRVTTWVYHLPDLDIAVQFETLENAFEKRENEILSALKSFKTIAKAAANPAEKAPADAAVSYEDLKKLTPEERKVRRQAMADATAKQLSAKLPNGWSAQPMGRFFVLSHVDQSYAQKVVEQGDAILAWLDKNLEYFGKGEFVRRPVLRIFKDQEEFRSYRGGLWWGGSNLEIVTYKDNDGWLTWSTDQFNTSVLNHWLRERDYDLALAFPSWLRTGLDGVFEKVKLKGGQLDFPSDPWERVGLAENVRAGKALKPREIMTTPGAQIGWANNRQHEATALVRYFIAGAGSRDTKMKTIFKNYLSALKATVLEISKESAGKEDAAPKKPKTEEEEEAAFKARASGWKEKEKRVLDSTVKRAFGSWKDADWDYLDNAYFSTIKNN